MESEYLKVLLRENLLVAERYGLYTLNKVCLHF